MVYYFSATIISIAVPNAPTNAVTAAFVSAMGTVK